MQKNRQELQPKYQSCFEAIMERIDIEKKSLTNRELLEICSEVTNFLSDETNPHLPHEIAETALNLLIHSKYAKDLLSTTNPAKIVGDLLKPLALRFPTESWRSQEQLKWQQFSTPPTIAYLLVFILNLGGSEVVLEPSAGTGNLAVWTAGNGIKTLTNEIDSRRNLLLRQIGFAPTTFDAEFIHDFLAPEITIDVVMMNPPFSANGGRTKNSSKYGFRHVESALERLKKGGRFGIILGEAGGLDTKTGREFWSKLMGQFDVKANLKLSGREYYKFGTTVDINLIFGEKLMNPRQIDKIKAVNQIPFYFAKTVEEAFNLIETHKILFNQ
jgi:type I restriction-modification system DNA methylase subunit